MKNEKETVAQENFHAADLTEEQTGTAIEQVAEEERPEFTDVTFPLYCEKYPFKGKWYWRYYCSFKSPTGKKIMNAELRPPMATQNQNDIKMYEILEEIFDLVEEATGKREYVLTCQRVSSKDGMGRRTAYMKYSVIYVTEEGDEFIVDLKPVAQSDKQLLLSNYNKLALSLF